MVKTTRSTATAKGIARSISRLLDDKRLVSYRLIDDKEETMADIAAFPLVHHLRGGPTTYVRHSKSGRVRHEGVAQSFWFQPLSATLSEVPVDDLDLPLIFH